MSHRNGKGPRSGAVAVLRYANDAQRGSATAFVSSYKLRETDEISRAILLVYVASIRIEAVSRLVSSVRARGRPCRSFFARHRGLRLRCRALSILNV